MIQLEILGGRNRGKLHALSTFPVTVGWSKDGELSDGKGLNDRHFKIDLNQGLDFVITSDPGDISINGAVADKVRLRNGDRIDAGSASCRFWISAVNAQDQTLRDQFVWTGIFAMGLLQIFLIFALLWR